METFGWSRSVADPGVRREGKRVEHTTQHNHYTTAIISVNYTPFSFPSPNLPKATTQAVPHLNDSHSRSRVLVLPTAASRGCHGNTSGSIKVLWVTSEDTYCALHMTHNLTTHYIYICVHKSTQ